MKGLVGEGALHHLESRKEHEGNDDCDRWLNDMT